MARREPHGRDFIHFPSADRSLRRSGRRRQRRDGARRPQARRERRGSSAAHGALRPRIRLSAEPRLASVFVPRAVERLLPHARRIRSRDSAAGVALQHVDTAYDARHKLHLYRQFHLPLSGRHDDAAALLRRRKRAELRARPALHLRLRLGHDRRGGGHLHRARRGRGLPHQKDAPRQRDTDSSASHAAPRDVPDMALSRRHRPARDTLDRKRRARHGFGEQSADRGLRQRRDSGLDDFAAHRGFGLRHS